MPRLLFLAAALLPATLSAQTAVLTQHNDNLRTGANLTETTLTPANVTPQTFGLLARHILDDQLYTQPLVVPNVKVAGGTHTLVFVTTVNNSVYAFDALDPANANPLWHVNFGTPANLHSGDFGCLDMNGNVGIVGTPVIDPQQQALYVVSLTQAGGKFLQRLHALDLATGADLSVSPATIEAPGFDPLMQNQRPALALSRGVLYIGYASHCDKQPYHGFLLAYDAATLKQTAVFNTSPGGLGASIWQSGQGPAIDQDGNLHLITGNGDWNGTTQWSESFLKLDPSLNLLDWFTPTNHVALDKADQDLDSAGASLIPGTHLVLGGGKEGVLYVTDTRHLGHLGDEHVLQHFHATGSHLHSLVFWDSAKNGRLLYVWGQRDKERVYRFHGDRIEENPWMTRPDANEGHPGAMLSLSANGKQDGILWAAIHATGDSWHESRPGVLHAYDANNIQHELWNSLQNAPRDGCGNFSKMAAPTIANGMVYLPSFGTENIGSGQLCIYGLLPGAGAPPASPTGLTVIANPHTVSVAWQKVPGAQTYTLERIQSGIRKIVASGLTEPTFEQPAEEKGEAGYRVIAVNANGVSDSSRLASARIDAAPTPRMMH